MTSTRTYFDEYLPKDLIEYLIKYTGPVDVWYIKKRDGGYWYGDNYQHTFKRKYGYVGKTYDEIYDIADKFGGSFHTCKVIFLDGVPFRLYEIPKLYGMPKKIVPKRSCLRCNGKTKGGKKCKIKTSHKSKLCHIHRNQKSN